MTFNVRCAPVIKEWNYCCCSCSLRAASIVLAWVVFSECVIQFATYIVYLVEPSQSEHLAYTENKSVVISLLCALIGAMVLVALMLYGIHKKKPSFMLPYLVMDMIGLGLLALAIVVITIVLLIYNWLAGLLVFAIGCFSIAVSTFFWVVLYSYYRQMEEEKNFSTTYTARIPCGDDQNPPAYDDEKALYGFPKTGEPEMA